MKTKVAIVSSKKDIRYPSIDEMIENKENNIAKMLEEIFLLYEYDIENYKNDWNPLKKIINPKDTVIIKPNMVLEKNQNGLGEECLYTNPAIVFEILKYCVKALKGNGSIIVADAPVQNCDFEQLISDSGYKKMIDYYKEQYPCIKFELLDLRGIKSVKKNGMLFQTENSVSKGITVDLGNESEHCDENIEKIRITNYDPDILLKHHNRDKHEYCVSDKILNANVIINIPKPKAHRKAGITLGMKNFVGVNVRKEYLPHHKMGSKKSGGDEYQKNSFLLKIASGMLDIVNKKISKKSFRTAKIFKYMYKIIDNIDRKIGSKEKYREGSWYGNDTIWRTILDINKIVYYCNKDGKMCDEIQRKIVTLGDMIIVGEKEGPLQPSPKKAGFLMYSENILSFDMVCATIMGIDYKKIPLYKNVVNIKKYNFIENAMDETEIVSNEKIFNNKKCEELDKKDLINIEPSSGWKGHIELE